MPHSMSMPTGIVHQRSLSTTTTYPYDVTLNRTDVDGFGFVIISSVNRNGSTIGMEKLHYYSIIFFITGRIIENSPADRCQRLQVGDRIIAVNGIDILRMHHGEIVNLIKDSGLQVRLTVGAPNGSFMILFYLIDNILQNTHHIRHRLQIIH